MVERTTTKVTYFRALHEPRSGWLVELFDENLRAMGILGAGATPAVFATQGDAERMASYRNYRPFPGHGQ